MLKQIKVAAWASDILRYVVLQKYGGLYLDTDIEAIHQVPEKLLDQPFTVCEKPRTNITSYRSCNIACTAVIAAPKGSKVMKETAKSAISKSESTLEKKKALEKEGKQMSYSALIRNLLNPKY